MKQNSPSPTPELQSSLKECPVYVQEYVLALLNTNEKLQKQIARRDVEAAGFKSRIKELNLMVLARRNFELTKDEIHSILQGRGVSADEIENMFRQAEDDVINHHD